ncbi:protein-L-isoaspartate O-methyltransferase family protein [Sphingosinicella sp.]|uniref:protein-L-isoaspartate O-methyltransferase family protein n=1 Tax=Sphingosinicella sp. TaxID=1917971 RepID=UPI0040380F16
MTEQNYQAMRRTMVESQLRTVGVNDPRVIAAMDAVPREDFVPAARRATAYADASIQLGNGRALNPPMALGRLLTEAKLAGDERVLLIGAATGYAAAVLARLVASVVALEEDASLAATALDGVTMITGSLAAGHAAGAPYDLILIDGAVEQVPAAIVDQVADGGRIATGLIGQGVTRLAIGRVIGGAVGFITFADAAIAPLPGFSAPRGFSF